MDTLKSPPNANTPCVVGLMEYVATRGRALSQNKRLAGNRHRPDTLRSTIGRHG